MAFNPEIQPVINTGQISSSRGVDTNDAFGVLFSGIGKSATNFLQAQATVDKTNLSLGIQDQVAEAGKEAVAQVQAPPDLQGDLAELQKLAAASGQRRDIGTLLLMKKAAIIKKATDQHPEYRDMIPDWVNSAMGADPNAQLAEHLDQLAKNADANASDQQKYWRQFARDNMGDIKNAVQAGLLPDIDYSNGAFDSTKVFDVVSNMKMAESQQKMLDAKAHIDNFSANQAASSAVSGMLTQMTAIQLNGKLPSSDESGYQKTLREALKDDGFVSGKERGLVMAAWSSSRQEGLLKVQQMLNQYTNLTPEQYAFNMKKATDFFDAQEKFLTDPNLGVFNLQDQIMKTQMTDVQFKMLQDPEVGPPLMQALSLKQAGLSDGYLNSLATERTGIHLVKALDKWITKGQISLQKDQEKEKAVGLSPDQVRQNTRAKLDAINDVLSGRAGDVDIATLAKSLYGNKDTVEAIDDLSRDNPLPMFNKLFNPEITKKLAGSPAFKDYYTAADRQFILFAKPLADTEKQEISDVGTYTVHYDEASSTFSIGPGDPYGELKNIFTIGNYGGAGKQHIDELNAYVQTMKPIVEAANLKMKDYLAVKLQAPEFNTLRRQGGIIDKMLNSILGGEGSNDLGGSAGKDTLETPQKVTRSTDAETFLLSKLNKDKPDSYIHDLDKGFQDNLAAMMQSAPPEIQKGLGVLSGARSIQRQKELWAGALKKYGSAEKARKWVAPPGHSQHNFGKAVDLAWNGEKLDNAPGWVIKWVHQNAGKYGLTFPLGNENWHIEPKGARA